MAARVDEGVRFALVAALALSACSRPPPAEVEWRSDHDAAVADAAARGVLALVFFRADWDMSSVELERSGFRDPRVREAMADLVAIRVDVTRGETELLERYGQLGTPSVIFVCPGGARAGEIHRHVPPERLLSEIEAAARACR